MARVRRNCLDSADDLNQFIRGVLLLKDEKTAGSLSTYDTFVIWHHDTMHQVVNGSPRNRAHKGPVFLPWHRYMLLVVEEHLRRVLGDDSFGIPYWNWWEGWPQALGRQSDTPGPFQFHEDGSGFNVVRRTDPGDSSGGTLIKYEPPEFSNLRRFLGPLSLPDVGEVAGALREATYDVPPWDTSERSFRNNLEGNLPGGGSAHNAAHDWVGGDMRMHTSPNDPVFYLLHANVDRIWAAWERHYSALQGLPPEAMYLPLDDEPDGSPADGHRPKDPLSTMTDSTAVTIGDVLGYDGSLYEYDTFADLQALFASAVPT